jgi:hypothetical protein
MTIHDYFSKMKGGESTWNWTHRDIMVLGRFCYRYFPLRIPLGTLFRAQRIDAAHWFSWGIVSSCVWSEQKPLFTTEKSHRRPYHIWACGCCVISALWMVPMAGLSDCRFRSHGCNDGHKNAASSWRCDRIDRCHRRTKDTCPRFPLRLHTSRVRSLYTLCGRIIGKQSGTESKVSGVLVLKPSA